MDILEIHKKLRSFDGGFPHFKSPGLKQSLAWCRMGLAAFYDGKITLFEALRNFLPRRFKGTSGESLSNYILWKISTVLSDKKEDCRLFGEIFTPSKPDFINSWLDTFILMEQILIRDQYHAKSFIKKDSIVVDAGANIGLFSIMASKLALEGKIYCYEPTPSTFQVLKKNCAPYKNIFSFQNGLGNQEATKYILESDCDGANTIEDSGRTEYFNGTKSRVKIHTLDSYNLPKVDFIKIDIEGYERQMLTGAKETIKKFSPVISVSAYHRPDDIIEIPKLIQSIDPRYKYRLYNEVEADLLFWQ